MKTPGRMARRAAAAAMVIVIVQAAGWSGQSWLAAARPVEAAEPAGAGSDVVVVAQPSNPSSPGEFGLAIIAPSQPVLASMLSVDDALQPSIDVTRASPLIWQGTAGQAGHVRAAPNTSAARVGELQPGQPIRVLRWVSGQEVEKENTTWADLGDGRFVYSALLRSRPLEVAPAPPSDAPRSGRWIDVNLTLQVATAYEGTEPVRSALVSTGRPGWETPRGIFSVQRRVAKETMDGRTLVGQGPNGSGASYKVDNVRWTQYFTADGSAIHENYWRNPASFGIPGSHGCIGMRPADAAWFWDFAATGTPIVVH